MLASVRWQSAFDAIRKEEFKLPQHIIKIKETLQSHAIFGSMDPAVIDLVEKAMRVVKVKSGEEVIKQGDAGDCLYVVLEGAFSVFVDDEKKDVVYGPGDCFGELALLYEAPRAATVVCEEPVRLFVLDMLTFKAILMGKSKQDRVEHVGFLKTVDVLVKHLREADIMKLAEALRERRAWGGSAAASAEAREARACE